MTDAIIKQGLLVHKCFWILLLF